MCAVFTPVPTRWIKPRWKHERAILFILIILMCAAFHAGGVSLVLYVALNAVTPSV